jgi:hypothetical protein
MLARLSNKYFVLQVALNDIMLSHCRIPIRMLRSARTTFTKERELYLDVPSRDNHRYNDVCLQLHCVQYIE